MTKRRWASIAVPPGLVADDALIYSAFAKVCDVKINRFVTRRLLHDGVIGKGCIRLHEKRTRAVPV